MSLFSRIAGVTASLFQMGGPSGNAVKHDGSAVSHRDSTDARFVNVRGLFFEQTPTVPTGTTTTILAGGQMLVHGEASFDGDVIADGDIMGLA
jgi:hypothetical protein